MNLTAQSIPYSLSTEQGVLSCYLQSPKRLLPDAAVDVPLDYFYHPANRIIYEVLLGFIQNDKPIDLVSLSHYLIDAGLIDKIGGPATLADLYSFVPTPAHYEYYLGILKQKDHQRKILAGCQEIHEEALKLGDDDASELLTKACDTFQKIGSSSGDKKEVQFSDQLTAYVDTLEDRILGKVQTGIPSRWRAWNKAFGGITPTMWTVCAFPKSGKTALAQNMAEDVLASGAEVLWYSYEMGETETIDRLVCAKSRVSSEKIFFPMQNPMTKEEAKAAMQAIGSMKNNKLHLRCEPTWTIEKIVAETRRMVRRNPGIRLIIIDYLQLVPTKKDFKNRSEQVAYISRTTKRDIQAANGIACVMLSQLNDDGKTLDSRAPLQDSSCVVTIEREHSEVIKGKTIEYPAGIRVNLNRNLSAGQLLKLKLNGQFFTFEEYQPDTVKQ
jgi:replicative DNA helicase